MADALKEIEDKAKALSAEERARLAEVLLESLSSATPPDVERAWELEIRERVAAYDRGYMQAFSAEDVFAEARRLAK